MGGGGRPGRVQAGEEEICLFMVGLQSIHHSTIQIGVVLERRALSLRRGEGRRLDMVRWLSSEGCWWRGRHRRRRRRRSMTAIIRQAVHGGVSAGSWRAARDGGRWWRRRARQHLNSMVLAMAIIVAHLQAHAHAIAVALAGEGRWSEADSLIFLETGPTYG